MTTRTIEGTPVFDGVSVMEVCMKHSKEAPEPPSTRSRRPVSPSFEALILRCLAKSPADRPANGAELLHAIEVCVVAATWTAADADAWWTSRNDPTLTGILTTTTSQIVVE